MCSGILGGGDVDPPLPPPPLQLLVQILVGEAEFVHGENSERERGRGDVWREGGRKGRWRGGAGERERGGEAGVHCRPSARVVVELRGRLAPPLPWRAKTEASSQPLRLGSLGSSATAAHPGRDKTGSYAALS